MTDLASRAFRCFLSPIMFVGQGASAQTISGTSVVTINTGRKGVIAADSRLTLDKGKQVDCGCKVSLLEGAIAFAPTGTTNFDSDNMPKQHRFNLYVEAAQIVAVHHRDNKSAIDGEEIARQWGEAAANRFKAAAPWGFKDWIEEGTDLLADGAFMWLHRHKVRIVFAEIRYKNSPDLVIYSDVKASNEVDGRGKSQIVDEFIHLKTQRARRENKLWQGWSKKDPDRFESKVAARLVELTKTPLPEPRAVGGDIDVIELTSRTGFKWRARKPSCPAKGIWSLEEIEKCIGKLVDNCAGQPP